MKVLIYGGGAVGLGIASCLLKAEADVDIISRPDTVAALKLDGLYRRGIFGDYHAAPEQFSAFKTLKEIKDKTYDYIIISAKSNASRAIAENLKKNSQYLSEKTKIVLFQNGWGNADIFAYYFPRKIIYNARVITGFKRTEKNQVEITVHADSVHIGSLYNEPVEFVKELSEAIKKGDLPCSLTNAIEKDLWAKMLYNCPLNPLGAIFQVPYGSLGESEYTREIMEKIVNEIFLVIEKSGYQTYWKEPKAYLKEFYAKLLPPTANHEASMLQDIRAKKRTEIDALNGAIVDLGDRLSVPVETNRLITQMIKFLESKNQNIQE